MAKSIRPIAWFTLFEAGASSPRSLRERICATVRDAIRSGRVRNGDRLPATRTLADDLRVSRITAEAAYHQLESEGYVRRRVGDGTYVEIDVPIAAARTPRRERAAVWSRRGRHILHGGGHADPSSTTAFSAGFPDLRAFPVDVWKRLTARRIRHDGATAMGYGDPAGEPELRNAIARYLGQSRGVRCDAEQVIVLTSSQQALQLIAMMLTDPGDVVAIEDPGYRGARVALSALGATIQPAPVDRDGIVLTAPTPRLIYTTPSHQYPTGVTMSLARRLALIESARRGRSYIIEDDYDSEFQYDARPTPAMQGLDTGGGRVLYVGTFSKVLFPALRLAYLVVPRPLVKGFITARTTHDGHPARLSQLVTADFMGEGHFAAHVRRMSRLYHHRRDVLLTELAQHVPWCHPFTAAAGLQLAVTLPRGREGRLTRAAARAGVVTPRIGGFFLSRARFDGWLLGFAALSDDAIVDGVRRLARLVGPR
jgi:GntR family transcriptional regulator/MocR family aminotransferase